MRIAVGSNAALPAMLVMRPLQRVILIHTKRQVQKITRMICTKAAGGSGMLDMKDANGWCNVRRCKTMSVCEGADLRMICSYKRKQRNKNDAQEQVATENPIGMRFSKYHLCPCRKRDVLPKIFEWGRRECAARGHRHPEVPDTWGIWMDAGAFV